MRARAIESIRVTTSLDTAWDAEERWMELVRPCLAEVGIFMPSIEEARVLSGRDDPADIAKVFLDCGVRTVVTYLYAAWLGPGGRFVVR